MLIRMLGKGNIGSKSTSYSLLRNLSLFHQCSTTTSGTDAYLLRKYWNFCYQWFLNTWGKQMLGWDLQKLTSVHRHLHLYTQDLHWHICFVLKGQEPGYVQNPTGQGPEHPLVADPALMREFDLLQRLLPTCEFRAIILLVKNNAEHSKILSFAFGAF